MLLHLWLQITILFSYYFSNELNEPIQNKQQVDNFSNLSGAASPSLRQVLIVHRHGDRTSLRPIPEYDKLAKEPFWSLHGRAQITNPGKRRLFQLGKIMSERYSNFLKYSLNKNHLTTRSSGSLRCVESAQMFLAGFLGLDTPDGSDSSHLVWQNSQQLAHLWQPSAIQSIPNHFDGMLSSGLVCNEFVSKMNDFILPSFMDHLRNYDGSNYEPSARLLKSLKYNREKFFNWIFVSDIIEVEKTYFPDKIESEIRDVYKYIEKAAIEVYSNYQSTFSVRRLLGGSLIHDLIDQMERHRSGNSSARKFIQYSTHDNVIIALLGMIDNWHINPVRPNFGANLVMELHEAHEWFVRIFYMQTVPGKLVELHIDSCEKDNEHSRCTLSSLKQLMARYTIKSWQQWMNECKNDYRTLNPYIYEN